MNKARRHPIKLVLFINKKKSDVMLFQFRFDNLFKQGLKTAVELMKTQKAWKMKDNDWEIFLQIKSKLNELKGKSKRII